MNFSIILTVMVVTATYISGATLSNPRECCEEVKIVYIRNNDVYERYPYLFTTYKLMGDNVTYMSKDDKYVLAVCDGRFNENCWKMALTVEEPHKCPSGMGQTWKYKIERQAEGKKNEWRDAAGGLEVICNPVDCAWNEWQAWGPCSETCGIGTQQRFRNRVREAAYGGSNCTGESIAMQECHVDPCPIDCTWGGWEPWGDCTKTCGGGVQLRTRLFFAGNSGKMCSGQSASMQECNPTPCPQTTARPWFFYDDTD